MIVRFTKPALVSFDGHYLSDHGRSGVEISTTRIGTQKRMANGTMRQNFVADKKSFSLSWSNLPHSSAFSVDGYWGADEIESFYQATPGKFSLLLKYDQGRQEIFDVLFTSFSKTPTKRGLYTFFDLSIGLDEV